MENKEIKQLTEADIDAIAGGLGDLKSMSKKDVVKKVLKATAVITGVGTVAGLGLIVGAKEHKPINKFIDKTVKNTKSLF